MWVIFVFWHRTLLTRCFNGDVGGVIILADGHVAICLDATRTIAGCFDIQRTTTDVHVTLSLDALRILSVCQGDIECTTLDDDTTCVFFLFHDVIIVICFIFHLNAVIHRVLVDSQFATIHLEELPYMDSVIGSFHNIDRLHRLLHLQILLRGDSMVAITRHIQCTVTLNLEVALRVEASLLLTTRIVNQRVCRTIFHDEVDALSTLDVDGSTLVGGEIHSVQHHREFVSTSDGE